MKRTIALSLAAGVLLVPAVAAASTATTEPGSDTAAAATTATTPATTGTTTAGTTGGAVTTAATTASGDPLEVPGEYDTIQAAVDAASPGDLILISPGTYHEAVNVTTDELTIRGLDRNEVVLDGQFTLDNGIRVLGASGVAVENMTAQNYTVNGFFWTGVTGYRGSYLTAIRNGDYGVYAFDSVSGQIDHVYASGSPDAGVYIGQCYECDAVVDQVVSEHNGLGYSGTNSGGELYIINSRFNNNRAGIVPNSGSYELCYPERETTIAGNLVYDNNQDDTPAIDVAVLAMGNGILVAGGVRNTIVNNRVWGHDRTGIGLVPFLEEVPNDVIPAPEDWDMPCSEQKELMPPTSVPAPAIWQPAENSITGNAVSDSGIADIAIATVGADVPALGNCWTGNEHTTSAPTDLEGLAPCEGEGNGGDWTAGTFDVAQWLVEAETAPPSVDYQTATLPDPGPQENMPDAATAPAHPATDVPMAVDLTTISTPEMPQG